MRTKDPIPGSPAAWLARARGDLALARAPLPEEAFYEDLCFHAQQAAEKAIKAVYRAKGLAFPYTHNLGRLLSGLRESGIAVPPEVEEAAELTSFAREARYPSFVEAVSKTEYLAAVAVAEKALRWAQTLVENETR